MKFWKNNILIFWDYNDIIFPSFSFFSSQSLPYIAHWSFSNSWSLNLATAFRAFSNYHIGQPEAINTKSTKTAKAMIHWSVDNC